MISERLLGRVAAEEGSRETSAGTSLEKKWRDLEWLIDCRCLARAWLSYLLYARRDRGLDSKWQDM